MTERNARPFLYQFTALGIARDDRTLVWIAIGLLGTSLAVRILQKVQQRRREKDPQSCQSGG